MKKIFAAVLCVLISLSCFAQQNSAVGSWTCTSDDLHGAVIHWTLNVTQSGTKLAGNIVNDDVNMPLIDPRFDGKALSFRTFVNPNCTILFEVTIDGKQLEGKFSCPEVNGTIKGLKSA
jgi:hypothetical protein